MSVFLHASGRMARGMHFAALVFLVFFQVACKSKPFRFVVVFEEAPALKAGSEVRYLGLKVGKVEKVYIRQGEGAGKAEVGVAVAILDRSIQIRRDDRFAIRTAGLLGEEFLDITPGPTSSPALPDGSTVRGEHTSFNLGMIPLFADALRLASRLSSLPKEKREELLETFDRLLDKAGRDRSGPPKANNSKKP